MPHSLASSISGWLRKRGKAVRPELTREQRDELKECFALIDTDGSGAIDADELQEAFKVLGMHVRRSEVEAMLEEVDRDGSGEVEYPEFVEIMTTKLADSQYAEELSGAGDIEDERDKRKSGKAKTLPFQLLAAAYRRKKMLEAVMLDQDGARSRFVSKLQVVEESESSPEKQEGGGRTGKEWDALRRYFGRGRTKRRNSTVMKDLARAQTDSDMEGAAKVGILANAVVDNNAAAKVKAPSSEDMELASLYSLCTGSDSRQLTPNTMRERERRAARRRSARFLDAYDSSEGEDEHGEHDGGPSSKLGMKAAKQRARILPRLDARVLSFQSPPPAENQIAVQPHTTGKLGYRFLGKVRPMSRFKYMPVTFEQEETYNNGSLPEPRLERLRKQRIKPEASRQRLHLVAIKSIRESSQMPPPAVGAL